MTFPRHIIPVVGFAALAMVSSSCGKDQSPSAAARVAPAASAGGAVAGQSRLQFSSGTATFLIDAPLEKIKGRSTKVRGNLDVDPANLKASKGTVEIDLDDLKTETFEDADKNKAQTGHSHNWLEIGPDVEAKTREENRWVRFTIKSIEEVSAAKLADAELKNGERAITARASGDLWLHGVSSPKTVKVAVTFGGPPEAPASVHVVSTEPLRISLKEHDVKPRDLAGKFLAGSLEKIGQKIDDSVQISLDLKAEK
jgi:polyisoprenoid-binding protein YceI